ncbi:MAG: ABC transporter ATP-binding protein [Desulfobacterales bacterium]|nr:MAG: ABC transporter ATP-binding protein [Desulfobacterales bacterium]
MSLLSIQHITAGYGIQSVLFDVSLDVAEGEVVAIIGPNGAGKTTLLRAILGFIRPNNGNISFKDQSIVGMEPEHIIRMGLGWVPQEESIFPSMTVAENLEMGAYILRGNLNNRFNEIYNLFPILKERMRQPAGSLSGGQRQMLAIARGLILQPDLLLLDEPTAGLAPNLVQMMLSKIKEVTDQPQRAVLLVTQTLDALRLCQRGYLLSSGKILYADTTDQLLSSQEVRELYFGGVARE